MEEVDVDVQTDAFLDRPPSPLFIPAKTGVDQATQIYEGDVKKILLQIIQTSKSNKNGVSILYLSKTKSIFHQSLNNLVLNF